MAHCLLLVTFPVNSLLLGILLLIAPSAGRPWVFLVAPDKAQCGNWSNDVNRDCDTLEQYLMRKDINFSLSDTTWIFLHGEHVLLKPSKMDIVGARNVTIKGEDKCGMEAEQCILKTTENDHYFKVFVKKSSHVKFKQLKLVAGYVFVTESSYVAFEHFEVEKKMMHKSNVIFTIENQIRVVESSHVTFEQFKTSFHFRIKVTQTSNLCLHSVDFRYIHLSIINPIGDYMVMDSILTSMVVYLAAYPHKAAENCSCSFTFERCRIVDIDGQDFIFKTCTDMAWQPHYHSINIYIYNSTFTVESVLRIRFSNFPMRSCTVEINNVTFKSGSIKFELPLVQSNAYPEAVDEWLGAHVLISDCNFVEARGAITIMLRGSRENLGRAAMKILILHTKFADHEHTLDHPNTVQVEILNNTHNVNAEKHGNLLTILQSTFKMASVSRFAARSDGGNTFAALALINLQGYRAVMAGGNQLVSNQGYGLMLENSQVEFHGYNEIAQSKYAQDGSGGIYMSPNSQLLLAPGTLLNVSGNTGHPYGGGIFISNMEEREMLAVLTEFVDCYIEMRNCPGWCFFQFINSFGQYVNASDIAEHNATVILLNNTATFGGNNVFNGHFQNCSLQTAHGTTPASKELVLNVFHQNPPMDKELIPSYPYVICLCDGEEVNCIRNHTFVIETYPVQQFPISVYVMADWQQVIPAYFNVVVKSATYSYQLDMNCTKVYTLEHLAPGTSHQLSLEAATTADDDAILIRRLNIQVVNSCSQGLVYEQHSCACNAFLKQHMFTCIVRTNTTTYRSGQPHYWIGMEEKHLLLSSNCPSFYCNSAVLLGGLTLNERTQNQQCNNGRQGLLCSECPSGYSSVFGSFQCKKCSSVWLLQLPLYVFGGIFIVAFLFLLNLTLLQGTIIGVVLYTNIMGLMADFLQEHAWGPLFFIQSVLNLQSGAGVCFYDGMDQFWKALLQFAFPFYLFTLLIVIIIVTHKCGYRMFRKARFIARRAVPVLATIMLLTYTSLVNAVITPLRYTTLYDADSTQGKTVWLYQPSLPFFGGWHIVLGILSIAVTLLYLIPFTFTMLFGDLMRRYFHKLWFSHFMDVLHGTFRWPLGFWIGLRLLLRVILVVVGINTKPNTSAFCSLVAAGTLLVVQLLVRPFRDPNSFREDVHFQGQGPPSCKRRCLIWMKRFLNTYHAPLFDTLYLLNIVQTSAVAYGSNSQTLVLSTAGANILILLALAQFAAILVYHAYNFFPVPEKARSCGQSCWSTMRAIPSMLKDCQCCRRGPWEEEDPRRSPTPILILRPPEIDESYESESETSSYSEEPPPEEMEVIRGERSLQEPLLAHSN